MPDRTTDSSVESSGNISVVVAEQHQLVRAGLSGLLSRETRCEIVGEATSLAELASAVLTFDPEVLLTEVCFDGVHDYDLLEQLSEAESGHVRVLVVSHHLEPHVIRETMRAGVSGYLPKDATTEELYTAVCTVADGDRYLHHRLGCAMFDNDGDGTSAITGREESVVGLAARGLTTTEMAGRLLISTRSVEAARASVRDKVGITTRAELYTFACDHGFLNSSCSVRPPEDQAT